MRIEIDEFIAHPRGDRVNEIANPNDTARTLYL